MRRHIFIPDGQVTPDTPIVHWDWIGKYILESRPDVIVNIGDFADMESLSYHDRGKIQFEGRRYINDINAARTAMQLLVQPMETFNAMQIRNHRKTYRPEMHLTMGNHEHRITRAIEENATLDGHMGLFELGYEDFGWTVHDFKKPVVIDGVSYCHYFYNPMTGRPYGGQSIDTRLKNIGFSFTMGHQQTLMTGSRFLNNGRRLRGIVCGSCYIHDEDYIGPQGNAYWRGIFVKNQVIDGTYDLMEISLDYLCRKYEGMRLWEYVKREHRDIYDNSIWMQHEASVSESGMLCGEVGGDPEI